MATITREEYLQKRNNNDARMHETKIKEREAIRNLNIYYDDLMRNNEQEYRRKRDAILAERDQKREEISETYKDERRRIWEEDTLLVSQYRAQLYDPSFTPPDTATVGKQLDEQ